MIFLELTLLGKALPYLSILLGGFVLLFFSFQSRKQFFSQITIIGVLSLCIGLISLSTDEGLDYMASGFFGIMYFGSGLFLALAFLLLIYYWIKDKLT